MRMPEMHMPDWKWYFEGERMRLLRWVLGIIVIGAAIALVVVFWPTIMQAGQRCIDRASSRETDELEEYPRAA